MRWESKRPHWIQEGGVYRVGTVWDVLCVCVGGSVRGDPSLPRLQNFHLHTPRTQRSANAMQASSFIEMMELLVEADNQQQRCAREEAEERCRQERDKAEECCRHEREEA